jgi:hypothetical protein
MLLVYAVAVKPSTSDLCLPFIGLVVRRALIALGTLIELCKCSARVISDSFDLLFPSVEEAQVCLPAHCKYTGEHESILRHDECKAERRDCWPQLERIQHADRYGRSNSFDDAGGAFACQDGLHPKEVG